jgi:toluene monooxygenase system ferredoxin subunit
MSADPGVETDVVWVDVPEATDMWQGDLLDVTVQGEAVLLVRHLDDTFTAYQGLCPHQELLLSEGGWEPDEGYLSCVGHNWEFDLRTGEGINPAGCRLYRYPVAREGDAVRIGVPQDGDPHYNRCR